MQLQNETEMQVVGPVVDQKTGAQAYTVHGERDVRFTVMPQLSAGRTEWSVQIEGVPEPCIVHDEPWLSPEEARDAALKVARTLLILERMQREDRERGRPRPPGTDESCEDQTGAMG